MLHAVQHRTQDHGDREASRRRSAAVSQSGTPCEPRNGNEQQKHDDDSEQREARAGHGLRVEVRIQPIARLDRRRLIHDILRDG